MQRRWWNGWSRPMVTAIWAVAPLAMVWLGMARVTRGDVLVGASLAGAASILALVNVVRVQRGLALARRRRPAAVTGPQLPVDETYELGGDVTLDAMSFHDGKTGSPVLSKLDLAIPARAFVGIVGRDRSGKSTLAKLISRRLVPTGGTIRWGSRDLGSFDRLTVRKGIALLGEDSPVFAMSLAENIASGDRHAPLDRVILAARAAGLHEHVMTLREGYRTDLSQRRLTAAQRQRLGLARAFFQGPRVVVLDRATSALDVASRLKIYATLGRIGCTCIVLERDVAALGHASAIAVLEGGRIVALGRHADLMRTSPIYRDLAETPPGAPRDSSTVVSAPRARRDALGYAATVAVSFGVR